MEDVFVLHVGLEDFVQIWHGGDQSLKLRES